MSDNGSDEEPVISDGLAFGDLGGAEIEVHAVVMARDGLDVKAGEPVDLQLEGHGWL